MGNFTFAPIRSVLRQWYDYGLPLVNMSSTIYTVYANNSGRPASTSLTLTINEPTPNIDYNLDNYTMSNGSSYTITPVLLDKMNNPSGTVIGQPSSWSISQSLPSGLNFGSNNGTIWETYCFDEPHTIQYHGEQRKWKFNHQHQHHHQRCCTDPLILT